MPRIPLKTDNELIQDIINARRRIKEAEAQKCNCTGFLLQYDGCCCGRKKSIEDATLELSTIIEAI